MAIAKEVSKRSCDADTKVGAIIVDRFNHILGTGFNSFPRGFPDDTLPNTRDEAYTKGRWMVHGEINCILNLVVSPFLYPEGVTLFCTVKPCVTCLGAIINANITTIYSLACGYSKTEQEKEVFDKMIEYSGIKYVEVI